MESLFVVLSVLGSKFVNDNFSLLWVIMLGCKFWGFLDLLMIGKFVWEYGEVEFWVLGGWVVDELREYKFVNW